MGELHEALFDKLTKLRKRDYYKDRGTWRGVSEIAGWMKIDKRKVREALHDLADAGRIERFEFANGIAWRGLPQHDEHVEARLYWCWCGRPSAEATL